MAKREKVQKSTQQSRVNAHHEKFIWSHFICIFFGFWLLLGHIFLGYTQEEMIVSDWVTAIVVIVFGFLSLSPRMIIAPWIVVLCGIWLEFAPLIFYAHDAVAYLNDTLVGVLLITFSFLIPGIPGMVEETDKHQIPPGWSYNPSAWIQRIPVITLACVGWFIARYLAAYQLGYVDFAWDPVFGDGTKMVLTSHVAHFFPVPDAGLGAFAYTLEALMGCKGGPARWRTMPWMVVGFVMLVVPLGVVSIILVISQPILVGYWCFLCLIAASAMLIMVMLTIDEMFAVFQFLHHAVKKEGQPFWRVFFKGSDVRGTKTDTRTPSFHSSPFTLIKTFHWGVGLPWNLVITAFLGLWMMFMPAIYGFDGIAADNDHLVGALVVVFSLVSFAEVSRAFRFILPLIGLWLTIGPWFFVELGLGLCFMHLGIGLLLILLAVPRGRIREEYGSLDKIIR